MMKRNVSTPPPLHCSATEPFTRSGIRKVPTNQGQHQQARAQLLIAPWPSLFKVEGKVRSGT